MPEAYLGLGSNKGERILFIEGALTEIRNIEDVKIVKSSEIYETEPWGVKEQNDYLNSVIKIETGLKAEDLLKNLKAIENKLGRTQNTIWSEREIDIDLLFYDSQIIENEFMKVPHLQIENRKFVLIPMNEISPEFIHPVFGKSISQLLSLTSDKSGVYKYNQSNIEK